MSEAIPTDFPLFCELCLVKFTSVKSSKDHYQGVQHRNKIQLLQFRESFQHDNKNLRFCDICCCMLNTEEALAIHVQSPKHIAKANSMNEIQEMKKAFLEARKANSTALETCEPSTSGSS